MGSSAERASAKGGRSSWWVCANRQAGFASALMFAAATAWLAGCTAAGGEATNETDGGASLPSAVAGATVAMVQVELPDSGRFMLRATVPVPKKLHGGSNGAAQLGFLNTDGTAVPAQVETVARYPRDDDGASVIELIARVERPAGSSPGQRIDWPVVVLAEPAPVPAVPASPAAALVTSPVDLPGSIADLLANPGNVSVRTRDVFGHEYGFDPLAQSAEQRVLKHGTQHVQIKSSGSLMPINPVGGSQGTLPHLFGAQAYIGTWSAEAVLTLDLRLHNGHDGRTTDPSNDALGTFYFEDVVVRVPSGYTLLQAFEDPKFGANSTSGGFTRFSVVAPEPGGKLHVFPRQAQFHRRLAIAPNNAIARARALLEQGGLGFVQRATNASGVALYSWWNLATARWFPQSFQLPSLAHVGVETLRAKFANDLAAHSAVMASGASFGNYPIESPRLGWAHPWGIGYGGMTGGVEINIVDGVALVEAASVAGVRHAQLTHRMNSDRQNSVLVGADGEPSRVSDWVVAMPVPHVPFSYYMKHVGSTDPFGWKVAPTFQVDAVVAQGRAPAYEAALIAYQSHDMQHLIRYTRVAKTLAWVSNDSLAKDDLLQQAELFRLSFHPYANSPTGATDGTGLRAKQDFAATYPNRGLALGRGEGWGIDVSSAAYATADPAWRTAVYPWFAQIALVLNDGIVPCSGHLQAQVNTKVLEGKYRSAQTYEDAILQNAMAGAIETVFRGKSSAHAALIDDVFVLTLQAMIGPIKWSSAPFPGPRHMYSVGPKEAAQGVWCKLSNVPSDGILQTVDKFQSWSSLGYGYERTKNGLYLTRAGQMSGGDLLSELLGSGTANIENRAALLAVMQRLNGQL